MRTTQRVLTVLISGLSLGSSVAAANSCFALVEKVVFTTTRDNPTRVPLQDAAEIYLMNADGSDPERITDNLPWGDTFPVLSPDGKKIIFESNRLRLPADPINKTELFVMATDGTEQTHLTDGSSASWAPDSKHIAFAVSASGTGTMIRPEPGAPTTDSDIFVINVDDGIGGIEAPVNITRSTDLIEADPDWSPDGQKIVYAAHRVDDSDQTRPTTTEIFLINVDGSAAPVQLTHNTSEERAPAWSPDGTRIVFHVPIRRKRLRNLHDQPRWKRAGTDHEQLRHGAVDSLVRG